MLVLAGILLNRSASLSLSKLLIERLEEISPNFLYVFPANYLLKIIRKDNSENWVPVFGPVFFSIKIRVVGLASSLLVDSVDVFFVLFRF